MDNITEAIVIEEEAPRRGRRPAARSGAAPAPAVEQQAAGLVADLRRDSITMPRQELAQSLHMAGATGMIAAFQYNETANRVAMLKLFAQIRDSKAYKGASVVDRNGETRVVSTWEEFCTAHGYSKRKIDEDLQNLAAFGGDFMELQEKLGLGYRDLRLLRNGIAALPPEERQAVLDDVAAADDSEEVKARLADLRLELAKARADRKELEADMQAKDKVSKEKSEKLDRLEEQVARLTSMSPDERQKALDEKNLAATATLDRLCNDVMQAALAVCAQAAAILGDTDSSGATCQYVHNRISALAEGMASTILASGIDVDLRAALELDTGTADDCPRRRRISHDARAHPLSARGRPPAGCGSCRGWGARAHRGPCGRDPGQERQDRLRPAAPPCRMVQRPQGPCR